MSTGDKETLIEFPATLTVKAMGLASEEFTDTVKEIVTSHLATEPDVSTLPSSGGKYVSVRVTFVATDADQLRSIYQSLHDNPLVLYTL